MCDTQQNKKKRFIFFKITDENLAKRQIKRCQEIDKI